MADTQYLLKSDAGKFAKAYDAMSYTVFFFGPIPMLIRQDIQGFIFWLVSMLAAIGLNTLMTILRGYTHTLDGFIIFCVAITWAVIYNNWHRKRLLKANYEVIEQYDITRRVLVF
ncbi:hypothetical protein [Spartinivicinus ruber]|uniref:hypothetical protein n=1 Tax=Spartinivicinus ruber TaxID=2683272 RepID=UPI0013D607CF|nr:hypothetical protein [Spartinivicinus ruber]